MWRRLLISIKTPALHPEDKSVDIAVTSINLPNWLDQKFFELHEENVVGYKSGVNVVIGPH